VVEGKGQSVEKKKKNLKRISWRKKRVPTYKKKTHSFPQSSEREGSTSDLFETEWGSKGRIVFQRQSTDALEEKPRNIGGERTEEEFIRRKKISGSGEKEGRGVRGRRAIFLDLSRKKQKFPLTPERWGGSKYAGH